MFLGALAFVLFGAILCNTGRIALFDFRTAYFNGKCLLQDHCDPYSESDIDRLYSQRPESRSVSAMDLTVITRNIYLPSAFFLCLPLGLLPFGLAQALWLLLIVASFLLAAYLMGSTGSEHSPLLAAALVAFLLANSGSVIFFGNPAGFVVPLTILAAWCFVRERFIPAAVACLAVSLAFKPHDAGLIWLYFLLAGGVYRKRALWTLLVVAALVIPAFLWTMHISPHWLHQLAFNLHDASAKGSKDDPSGGHGALVLTDLQCITSFFWPGAKAYNLAAYAMFAPFFLAWAFVTVRARPTLVSAWLGLAAIACFTPLPIYHRQYDAKLLLLTIPACAILWSRRRLERWAALVFTWAAFVLNGDLPWVVFLRTIAVLHLSQTGLQGRLLTAVWDFPVPLSLLALGGFYLWVYAREAQTGKLMDGSHPGAGASQRIAAARSDIKLVI